VLSTGRAGGERVTDLLARVRGVFVEPVPGTTPGRLAASRRAAVPPAAGLLCSPADALALGSALALSLQRGAPAGLVAVWRPEPEPAAPMVRAPANRHARRLTASLAARGIEATASGRLARAVLPRQPADAAHAADRALAAAQAPAVLVVAGPRCAALDEVLASLDLLLVAAPSHDESLAALAAAGLARLGPPTELAPPLSSPLLRTLAAAGVLAPSILPMPLRPLLETAGL
jgi:hypothetical protein